MANRFWSVNLGGDKTSVAETSTTTSGAAVEVRITYDATGLNKQAALLALEQIKSVIVQDTWPPA
jgi:hypothetical protein